ncbi:MULTISPECIES: carbamate kinase [Clostridium]|uniref:Carbamate kinase n=2 Tax=Clostridium TaxID=1485 RepID=D8GNJ1_CLOLD|nr:MULTISPECIES: carbamate kinase [Clostridium]ADK15854.1 carbamate kinase [Clostridium ljungdahlii DSM 13528]OAA84276.1 Carbamate kinase 1 [Clostridium ljungdahlii DSM 13528]RMC99635.1 carbamate kinase [Clostridium autoethanogenum]
MSKIVVALGGNALQANPNDKSAETQLKTCIETAKPIVDLIEEGHEVVIAHGNGPQVGQLVAAYETAAAVNEKNPIMPFPECGAMSQGYIGYQLQQAIKEEMKKRGLSKEIATVITQVVVDENDPAFKNPTKPVGSFFTEEQAKKLMDEKGYVMKEDANRGWRRVVPSPLPKTVIEEPVIKTLVNAGHVVITVGGGGIPVVDKGNGNLEGVPAVIDKDFASEKIAELLNADKLVILTAVEQVSINFGKPNQKNILKMTVDEAERYIEEGHFAPGSMLPKVKAALSFVQSKIGRIAVITSLEKAKESIMGLTGTTITV